MPREKEPECRGILVAHTNSAFCVKKDGGATEFWLPRSQIGYCRKTTRSDGTIDIVFTCPEWLIEKKACWELVP